MFLECWFQLGMIPYYHVWAFGNMWRHFGDRRQGIEAGGMLWHLMGREARDTARHPAVHKAISPTTQNYPAQIASTAEVQKPWYIV